MQYVYTECRLPSNGKIYDTEIVHLRPKTIFDIKTLLNNPMYMLKSEIDALQNCIDPQDNVNVYDLVNQDVVYLLYKLRSMSDDNLTLTVANKQYNIKLSELNIDYLDKWEPDIVLPESGIKVTLAYQPIKNSFEIDKQQKQFEKDFPDFKGDVLSVVQLLNKIASFDGTINKVRMRNKLEELSWKDSLYLLDKIDQLNSADFGIKEEVTLNIDNKDITIPLQINENFFRPSL